MLTVVMLEGVYVGDMSEVYGKLGITHIRDNSGNRGGCQPPDSGRNYPVDVLRFIGTVCVILAHTNIRNESELVADLRMFDVVMLVFLSGIMAGPRAGAINSVEGYCFYIYKRIRRLLFPTWIFLTGYFVFAFVIRGMIPNDEYTIRNIILSYTLFSGIGYVWIIRIYLCMALVAPFLERLIQKTVGNIRLVIVYTILMLINSALDAWVIGLEDSKFRWVSLTAVVPILGYSIIYMIAMAYSRLQKYQKVALWGASAVLFVVWCMMNGGFDINNQKYPPNIIYLTYGLLVSMTLYELFEILLKNHRLEDYQLGRAVVWVSRNSLYLYLAHIVPLFFFKYLWESAPVVIEFPILLVTAIAMVIIFNKVKSVAMRRT